jgi:hypothetical protein
VLVISLSGQFDEQPVRSDLDASNVIADEMGVLLGLCREAQTVGDRRADERFDRVGGDPADRSRRLGLALNEC